MKEQTFKHEKRNGKKILMISLSVLLGVLIILSVMSYFALSYNGIYRGVSCLGNDLGYMTKAQAEQVLEKSLKSNDMGVTIEAMGKSLYINLNDYGEVSAKMTAESAYLKGRDNLFTKFITYYTPFIKRDILVQGEFDEFLLKQAIINFNTALPTPYIEDTFEINGDKLIIYTGKGGNHINKENAIEKIIEAVSNKENHINMEVLNDEYKGVDIDGIYKLVYAKAKDATANEETEEIFPHVTGYDFDLEKARQTVLNAKENEIYEIDLIVTEPKVTLEMLEIKFFKDTLGTFSTNYSTADLNRSLNVALAASKINNKVMQPGEVFSYNQTVGNRTASAGFKTAHVYVGNEVVDGIGGGICQVSSTLYNAVIYANLGIVSRTNHSMPVAYTPLGQDATVSWGTIDFKFKNTSNHPIKIEAIAEGGVCTVTIKGKIDEEFKVSVSNTITKVKPFETEYVEDETLPEGEEKVIKKGAQGYTVKTYRTVTKDGKVVKTETLPASNYVPVAEVVARNTPEEEPEEITTDEPLDEPLEEDNPLEETPEETVVDNLQEVLPEEETPLVETPEENPLPEEIKTQEPETVVPEEITEE